MEFFIKTLKDNLGMCTYDGVRRACHRIVRGQVGQVSQRLFGALTSNSKMILVSLIAPLCELQLIATVWGYLQRLC